MSLLRELERALLAALPAKASEAGAFLERPRQAGRGDVATGLAMRCAAKLGEPPRQIAARLAAAAEELAPVQEAEVAGPGFVNITLTPKARFAVVGEALAAGAGFGSLPSSGRTVLVEFVSANPTGPLHVGHGRGAAIGDSLARLLRFRGDAVVTEYYLNDRGLQIDVLAASLWLRVLDELGAGAGELPAGAYQGAYLREVARAYLAANPATTAVALDLAGLPDAPDKAAAALARSASEALGEQFERLRAFAVAAIGAMIKEELAALGVEFDSWRSEAELDRSGAVKEALGRLEAAGHCYERDGATWFAASAFGDEKDRVLRRSDGSLTYFATDVAYHLDKGERGADMVCTLLGQDHHGYVPRLLAALKALDAAPTKFSFDFIQFVALVNVGERVSMSTRSGEFLPLAELAATIGADATRLYYVLSRGDAPMDIDVARAKRQGNDNPVYYIQYAHARICTLLAAWGGEVATLGNYDAAQLAEPEAAALAAELLWFEPMLGIAAREREPHRIAHWLIELAAALHRYYEKVPILKGPPAGLASRLALLGATRQALANGLGLLGVGAPFKMASK